jgi:hypothetical protein
MEFMPLEANTKRRYHMEKSSWAVLKSTFHTITCTEGDDKQTEGIYLIKANNKVTAREDL